MVDWIIWYENEGGGVSSFSSEDGEPWEAPRYGILAIAVKDEEVGRKIMYRGDFYWYHWVHGWLAGDREGFYDYMFNQNGKEKVVLLGRVTTDAQFLDMLAMARNDPRLPAKSAYARNEKKPFPDVIEE